MDYETTVYRSALFNDNPNDANVTEKTVVVLFSSN